MRGPRATPPVKELLLDSSSMVMERRQLWVQQNVVQFSDCFCFASEVTQAEVGEEGENLGEGVKCRNVPDSPVDDTYLFMQYFLVNVNVGKRIFASSTVLCGFHCFPPIPYLEYAQTSRRVQIVVEGAAVDPFHNLLVVNVLLHLLSLSLPHSLHTYTQTWVFST